jgi:hypothetical protein
MRYILLALAGAMLTGCSLFPVDMSKTPTKPGKGKVVQVDVPDETFGLDTKIPKVMHNRKSALQLAAVCDQYARAIEYDGEKDEPLLRTTDDVGRRFKAMNDYAWHGPNTLAPPDFKSLTSKLMKDQLDSDGTSPELTKEKRALAVSVFEAIAYGLKQVQDDGD